MQYFSVRVAVGSAERAPLATPDEVRQALREAIEDKGVLVGGEWHEVTVERVALQSASAL